MANNNEKLKDDRGVIRKVKKESAFAQILNELINNRELSYKALGILVYILSKPDDWQVYISDLVREGVDGEKSVRNGLNELIEKRYVQRYRVYNDETGKVNHWETLVSETPFPEEELISSVRETYALKKNGEIAYQKMTVGTFERYFPIVAERKVILLSQKGEVEKNNNKVSTLPKGTSRKATSRKRSTTYTNSTNTKSITNTKSSSSSKGIPPSSLHPLVELFNSSICELKKTTTIKFMQYVEKYDQEFIEAMINYCEERNAKSYAYFSKTIERYISEGIVTVEDMNKSIEAFNDKNKTKKNKALKAKDEKKQEEEFDVSINDRMMDDLAGGIEIETPVELTGEDISEEIKEKIKPMISEVSYNTWIKNLKIRLDNNMVIVGCPNDFTRDIVERRYADMILESMQLNGINADLSVVEVAL